MGEMQSGLRRVVKASSLVGGIVLFAVSAWAADRSGEIAGYVQERRQVADRIHALYQPRFFNQPAGNVTIVEQSDGLVLVDAGDSFGQGQRVVRHVRAVSAKPVKAIIVTHWHGDHHFGLSALKRAWPGATVIATQATADLMNTQGLPSKPDEKSDSDNRSQTTEIAASYAELIKDPKTSSSERAGFETASRHIVQYGEDLAGTHYVPAELAFADKLVIRDDVAPVEILFLGRANTSGDAIVWMPKQKVVAAGDAVVAPVPFGLGVYPNDWIRTLGRIKSLGFAVLIPGHGPPQTDASHVDRLLTALLDVKQQVEPLAAQGLPMQEVQSRVDFSRQAAAFAGEDAWLRRWVSRYWEPVASCFYKDAKKEPIVQGRPCRAQNVAK